MGQERSEGEPEDHPAIPSRSIRPSRMTSVRSARDAMAWSCVTMTTAVPSCWTRSKSCGDLLAGCAIELSGRLVGEKQHRAIGERPCDGHPLHFSARELRRAVVRAMREPDVFQQLGRSQTPSVAGHAGFGLRELDVLPGRQHGKQKESLKDEPDLPEPHVAAIGIRQRADIAIFEEQRSARRRVYAPQDVQQRGFPAARRSPDGDVLRGIDSKRDATHGGDGTGRHRKHPGDVARVDHPITSVRNVDEIGSRATVRIG